MNDSNICKRFPKDVDCHYLSHRHFHVIYIKSVEKIRYCNPGQFKFVLGKNYEIWIQLKRVDTNKYDIKLELLRIEDGMPGKTLVQATFHNAIFYYQDGKRLSISYEDVEIEDEKINLAEVGA